MLINIPVKFYDPRSNTFELLVTQVENCKIFCKSMTITLQILNNSTRKYPGAQLHRLINIPFKFYDSMSDTFEFRETQVENFLIFTKSRAITLKY
jgi:hypothetical protein